MLKEIDLTNKCGSCCYFRKIYDTAQGECLKNPYGENVVHDPKYPYWIVPRSRIKCRWYKAPLPTNADRIRAMSDKELARFLADKYVKESCLRLADQGYEPTATQINAINHTLYCIWMKWLKQPAEGE